MADPALPSISLGGVVFQVLGADGRIDMAATLAAAEAAAPPAAPAIRETYCPLTTIGHAEGWSVTPSAVSFSFTPIQS